MGYSFTLEARATGEKVPSAPSMKEVFDQLQVLVTNGELIDGSDERDRALLSRSCCPLGDFPIVLLHINKCQSTLNEFEAVHSMLLQGMSYPSPLPQCPWPPSEVDWLEVLLHRISVNAQ